MGLNKIVDKLERYYIQDKKKGGPKRDFGPRVNNQIRVQEIRLITDGTEEYGVVSISQARLIADDKGLDLVEVSPTAKPPVVKLIDYGKFKYQAQKRISDAKKKQTTVSLKEIKLRPNIEQHDLDTKLKKVTKFLAQGDKVKLLMQFRGREMAHKDLGLAKFNTILDGIVQEGAVCESRPKMMGNRVIALIGPIKK